MFLIVGLGNPGAEYRFHRHNIGFLVIDILHDTFGTSDFSKTKWSGVLSEGSINGEKILFLKPQTYMNLSGKAVGGIAAFYKIPTENIFVIHDDIDLPVAELRIKKGGGHGGHNGLKSLDSHIGKNYWRMRIGVDHPGDKNLVSGYVLQNIPKKDISLFEELFKHIDRNFSFFFDGDKIVSAKI